VDVGVANRPLQAASRIVTPVVQAVRGDDAAWGVMVPIGIISVIVLVLLGRLI
jgi:hypothetical protein